MASGKGMNAAKVLRRLGHDVHLLQVLGGANGKRCLAGCEALGIRSVHAWADEETRLCTTLVDLGRGQATEIIEPFETRTAGLEDALLGSLPSDPAAYAGLLLCGTVPPGVSRDIYARLLDRFAPRVSLLDAWQGVDAALLGKAGMVKVNRREYAALEPLAGAGGPLFLVTDGAREAAVIRGGRTLFRIPMAALDKVVNPIGAGDTVSAGTLHFLLEGLSPEEAFRRGLALGSASCLRLEIAGFAWEDYEALLPRVGPAREDR
jgi:fructose-1-phosphate kinase PfkB-like protein